MKSTVLAYSLLIGAALSAASWDTGSWDIETWQPAANNILSGLQPAEGSNVTPYAADNDVGGAEKFTDGKVPTVQGGDQYADTSKVMRPELSMIGDKNVLVYRWSGVMDIKDVRLYTMWCDGGRDYIRVYGVDYLTTASADWKEIPGSELAAFETETFRNRAILRAGDGEFLAEGVIALRIRFGTQENKFCGYAEIEASVQNSRLSGSLTLDSYTVNSASLTAEIGSVGPGVESASLHIGYGTDRDAVVLSPYEGGTLTMENPRISVALTGLEEGTTYFYKYCFQNDAGAATEVKEGSFTTGRMKAPDENGNLILEYADAFNLPGNDSIEIGSIYNNGTIALGDGSVMTFNPDSFVGTNDNVWATMILGENSRMTASEQSGKFFNLGYDGGYGRLAVEEEALLDLKDNDLRLAYNQGDSRRDAGSLAAVEISGTVKCRNVQGDGYYPTGRAPASSPRDYPMASEVTIFTNGCLDAKLFLAYDYARCNLTLAGGTLRIGTSTSQFFGTDKKASVLMTLRAGTTNIIDVGENDVTLALDNFYFEGSGTLIKKGSGALAINAGAKDSFTGDIIVEEGEIRLSRVLLDGQEVLVRQGARYIVFASSDESHITFEGGVEKVRFDVVEDLSSGYDLLHSSMYLDNVLGGPYSGTVKLDGQVFHGEVTLSSPFTLYGNGGTLALNGTGLENGPLLLNGSGTFSFAGDRVIDSEGDIAFAEGSSAVYNQEGELAFSGFTWKYPSENISFSSLRIGNNAAFAAKSPAKEADKYRYYRFVVDKTTSGGMQMTEFEIYSGAVKIEVNRGMGSSYERPAGTSGESAGNALDGDSSTKFYDGKDMAAGNCYLQIDLGEGNAQAVTGYRWMTGNDNGSWKGRNPTAWRFLGSNDGKDWTLLDQYENMPDVDANYKWTEEYAFHISSGILVENKPIIVEEGGLLEVHGNVRPFSVSGDGTVNIVGADSALCLIGTENPDMTGGITGEGSLVKEGLSVISAKGVNTYQGETVIANGMYNVYGNSHPIRYFKLVITDAGANNDHCTQLTRFALFAADGEDQALGLSMKGVGTDATTLKPGEFYRAMDYRNYDGNADTLFKDNYDKWCFANQNGGPGNADAGDGTYTLVMRLKDDAKEVVSYNFRSGGDDEKYHDRSLRGWILYGSENGTDWFVLDEREGFPNVAKNNVWYNGGAAFPCRYFSRTNDRDFTIPAGSVVEVARGARLGVYTAMTISALRVALDGEGASPVVDGLNMASSGALYLTSEDSVSLAVGYQLPINLKNLGPRSNWPVYLNGKRTTFVFHAVEGDGTSYLKKSGMILVVR